MTWSTRFIIIITVVAPGTARAWETSYSHSHAHAHAHSRMRRHRAWTHAGAPTWASCTAFNFPDDLRQQAQAVITVSRVDTVRVGAEW